MLVLFVGGVAWFSTTHTDHTGHDSHEGHGHAVHEITSEKDFIEHMIPHHQEAVDTSRVIVERGGTIRPIKDLAQNIITAQEKEISDMQQWYLDWYSQPYQDTGVYELMMRDLASLEGKELDRIYLEDMIHHHEMAVEQAEAVLEISPRSEVRQLAEAIILTQTEEIVEIKNLLNLLGQN